MKKSRMVEICAYFVLGVALASANVTVFMWQWWLALISAVVISCASAAQEWK
jgi:CHASE2 domain-containing sensor protein